MQPKTLEGWYFSSPKNSVLQTSEWFSQMFSLLTEASTLHCHYAPLNFQGDCKNSFLTTSFPFDVNIPNFHR